MDRWVGKVAVVTGASAGVGEAIASSLVKKGLIVVGVARRLEKLQELQSSLTGSKGKLVPLQGDVSREEDITIIFDYVKKTYNTLHLLVNNAGFMIAGTLIDGDPEDWRRVFDVNVLGLTSCAQKAIKLMRDSGVDDGQIINVNSMAGHRIPPHPNPMFNVYPPSKYAVTAISETLRAELQSIKSKIRVTNLCPGYIKTEFQSVAVKNNDEYKKTIDQWLANRNGLVGDDLAYTVEFILSTPQHVQIYDLQMGAV